MVITKLLEGILTSGQTALTFTDSDIPNSFIRVGSTNPDVFPTEQTISGNTLTIKYDAQNSDMGVIVELVKSDMIINNTLTSNADDEALSAAMGKALKDLIDALGDPSLDTLTDVDITSPLNGSALIYDSVNEKWISGIPSISIDDLTDATISNPVDDEVLTYDDGAWINKPVQGGSGINYSNTEVRIGTWTDGKPLYQITKTLTTGIAINTYGTIDLPSGIVVRDIKGYIYRANHQSVDMFNGYINNGQIFVTVRNGDIQYMISNVFSDIEELDITIQYTKTSD